MKKEILDEVLKVQEVFYNDAINDEEKMELFMRFLEDGTELRQVLLLTILFVDPDVKIPGIHEKGICFVVQLQKMGLIPWDLQRLRRIYPIQTVFKRIQLLKYSRAKYYSDVDELTYYPLLSYAIENDDIEVFTHLIDILKPDPSNDYIDSSMGTICRKIGMNWKKASLLEVCLFHRAMRCLAHLLSIGHTFTSQTPLKALRSCSEEQFKELGLEVMDTEMFYQEAVLCRRLWILNTPQFKNSKHREKIKEFAELKNVYVERDTFQSFFSGYLTSAYQDYDIGDYERYVQLCDVVYNEESTKEEIKAAMERLPDFKVLQKAAYKRPKLFDIYVKVAMELANEGKLALTPSEGENNLLETLQKKGFKCERSPEKGKYWNPTEEQLHPGYVEGFGFVFLNDNAEAFNELVTNAPIKRTPNTTRISKLDAWMMESARHGSQRCFEIGLMNGGCIDRMIVSQSIAGGNWPILHQCMARLEDESFRTVSPYEKIPKPSFIDQAMKYRRLEIADWLLENDKLQDSEISISPDSLIGYHFLPVHFVPRFIYPNRENLLLIIAILEQWKDEKFYAVVCSAMDNAIESGFRDIEITRPITFRKSMENMNRIKLPSSRQI